MLFGSLNEFAAVVERLDDGNYVLRIVAGRAITNKVAPTKQAVLKEVGAELANWMDSGDVPPGTKEN